MDLTNDMPDETAVDPSAPVAEPQAEVETSQSDKALVQTILKRIKADITHHEAAFKRMRRDQMIATHGRTEGWHKDNYTANIAGRHVKTKTAALYAKNPKCVARRKETLDFAVWDENPQSLMLAMQTIQAGMAAAQAHEATQGAQAGADPEADMLGHNGGPPLEMPPGFDQAQAVIQDFQQGMQRRQTIDKIGKTLEILFTQALREQKPVDFKTGAKQMVRRTTTTGVGYCELAFQRDMGPRPGTTEQLADARVRLDHLKRLQDEVTEGEIVDGDSEMAELQHAVEALQNEPEIVLREGLIFDFPRSTKVIPDKLCKTLVGFIGARHVTVEYDFTVEEVEEIFGVDLAKGKYTPYSPQGDSLSAKDEPDMFDGDPSIRSADVAQTGLVRVWKCYDKPAGLVYYVADGYDDWLRPPAAPDVFVEDFWPVYALTFNEVENDVELFPPSDVALITSMQDEHNRSRQGKREHRRAARPRWAYPKGALEPEDIENIGACKPFEAVALNMAPGSKIADILQAFPVPGVDPNIYDTNETFGDMQLVVGTQEATLGGMAKATATEAAISAGSSQSTDGSSIDDLDSFLTTLARAAGQILLKNMSEEQVKKVVGVGAVWPQMSLADIADEVFLEVQAGSSGKPNRAMEMANWEKMLPFLIQMPGIQPAWLARETLTRLDDRLDLTAALAEGIASIVAQNGAVQPSPADPSANPTAQGAQGGNNGPKAPGGPSGTGPAFGSNQV